MAGYFNYSKSNNAVAAERDGKYPATRFAQIYGFKSAKSVRECLKSSEWHHTSKRYNITDYYDFESYLENIERLNEFSSVLKNLKKNSKAKELIFDRAKSIIRANLSIEDYWVKFELRKSAGYFGERKRDIKRKYY